MSSTHGHRHSLKLRFRALQVVTLVVLLSISLSHGQYYGKKGHPIPIPVHKPYPVKVPQPVPVAVRVDRPVKVNVPVPVPVAVPVNRPVKVPVHVDRPYPVMVKVPAPYPVYPKKHIRPFKFSNMAQHSDDEHPLRGRSNPVSSYLAPSTGLYKKSAADSPSNSNQLEVGQQFLLYKKQPKARLGSGSSWQRPSMSYWWMNCRTHSTPTTQRATQPATQPTTTATQTVPTRVQSSCFMCQSTCDKCSR